MRNALVLLGAIAILSPPASPQTAHVLAHLPSATAASIPFKLYNDYIIVVHGSIGPLQGLNFLLDTGANPTAVDRRLAKKLRLVPEKSRSLTLLNQKTRVEQVVLPSVQLGPIRAESLAGVVQDLAPITTYLGIRIDAIVGFAVLSQSSFAIDYASKKLLFGSSNELTAFSIPLNQGPASFTVRFEVQNRPVSLLVDTGSSNLILFACQLPQKRGNFVTRGLKASRNSSGKVFQLREVLVSQLRLGLADFGVKPALISDDDINCGQSLDGVVGPASLGLKWIAFDFDHLRFGWR